MLAKSAGACFVVTFRSAGSVSAPACQLRKPAESGPVASTCSRTAAGSLVHLAPKRPPFGTFRKTCGLVEKQSLSEQFVKRRIPPAPVEEVVAPAAIERALNVYEQLQPHDLPVRRRARKIATRRIYGMVDQGEHDEQRLTIDGVAHLKAVERDAQDAPKKKRKKKVSPSLTK